MLASAICEKRTGAIVVNVSNEAAVANNIYGVSEPLPKTDYGNASDPGVVARQSFDEQRRGYDQQQVRAYLQSVAAQLSDAQRREAEMRSRLAKAVRRADAAEKRVVEIDHQTLSQHLGEEVAGVIDAARVAADQRISAAEASAEQIIQSAMKESARIRRQAETVLEKREAEAKVHAQRMVDEANAYTNQLRKKADKEAKARMSQVMNRLKAARDESDAMIRDAQEARDEILNDLESNRRVMRSQVERLKVGRDRLLRSYEQVKRTADETTAELKGSLRDAKVHGDSAAGQVMRSPLASTKELNAELELRQRKAKFLKNEQERRELAQQMGNTFGLPPSAQRQSRSKDLPKPTSKPANSNRLDAGAISQPKPSRAQANDRKADLPKTNPKPQTPSSQPRSLAKNQTVTSSQLQWAGEENAVKQSSNKSSLDRPAPKPNTASHSGANKNLDAAQPRKKQSQPTRPKPARSSRSDRNRLQARTAPRSSQRLPLYDPSTKPIVIKSEAASKPEQNETTGAAKTTSKPTGPTATSPTVTPAASGVAEQPVSAVSSATSSAEVGGDSTHSVSNPTAIAAESPAAETKTEPGSSSPQAPTVSTKMTLQQRDHAAGTPSELVSEAQKAAAEKTDDSDEDGPNGGQNNEAEIEQKVLAAAGALSMPVIAASGIAAGDATPFAETSTEITGFVSPDRHTKPNRPAPKPSGQAALAVSEQALATEQVTASNQDVATEQTFELEQAFSTAAVSQAVAAVELVELEALVDAKLHVIELADELEQVKAIEALKAQANTTTLLERPKKTRRAPKGVSLFDSLREHKQRQITETENPVAEASVDSQEGATQNQPTSARANSTKASKPTAQRVAETNAKSSQQAVESVKSTDEAKSTKTASAEKSVSAQKRNIRLVEESMCETLSAQAASKIERGLRRALADEQNDVFYVVRNSEVSTSLIEAAGEQDAQIAKYIDAIRAELFNLYGVVNQQKSTFEADSANSSGTDATDEHGSQAALGLLPAAAIETLIVEQLVGATRSRLARLDRNTDIEERELLGELRGFYRESKSECLPALAASIAKLVANSASFS